MCPSQGAELYFLNAGGDTSPTPDLVPAASLTSASTGPKMDLSKQLMNLQWDVSVYLADATLNVHQELQITAEQSHGESSGKG